MLEISSCLDCFVNRMVALWLYQQSGLDSDVFVFFICEFSNNIQFKILFICNFLEKIPFKNIFKNLKLAVFNSIKYSFNKKTWRSNRANFGCFVDISLRTIEHFLFENGEGV